MSLHHHTEPTAVFERALAPQARRAEQSKALLERIAVEILAAFASTPSVEQTRDGMSAIRSGSAAGVGGHPWSKRARRVSARPRKVA